MVIYHGFESVKKSQTKQTKVMDMFFLMRVTPSSIPVQDDIKHAFFR